MGRTKQKFTKSLQKALLYESMEEVLTLLNKTVNKSEHKRKNRQRRTNDFQKCQKVVKICLRHKLNFNIPETKYSTLLHFVAKYGDDEAIRLVHNNIKNFDINALNPDKHSLLYIFINMNKEAWIKKLIDNYGADINVKGSKRSALHYAIIKNKLTLVRYFLDKGADVNIGTNELSPGLHYAVCIGNKKIIKMLFDAGANINGQNRSFRTPLFEACGGSIIEKTYFLFPDLILKKLVNLLMNLTLK